MINIKLTENIEHLIAGIVGVLILLVAFNIINPFKGEKEITAIKQYNLLFKILGAFMVLNAVVRLLFC
ncbi:MAG TPA: hypothetical protein PLW44_17325 [Chitinophagales bacterium]|nr:hypothetical protein [Chitinophagales bacterium]